MPADESKEMKLECSPSAKGLADAWKIKDTTYRSDEEQYLAIKKDTYDSETEKATAADLYEKAYASYNKKKELEWSIGDFLCEAIQKGHLHDVIYLMRETEIDPNQLCRPNITDNDEKTWGYTISLIGMAVFCKQFEILKELLRHCHYETNPGYIRSLCVDENFSRSSCTKQRDNTFRRSTIRSPIKFSLTGAVEACNVEAVSLLLEDNKRKTAYINTSLMELEGQAIHSGAALLNQVKEVKDSRDYTVFLQNKRYMIGIEQRHDLAGQSYSLTALRNKNPDELDESEFAYLTATNLELQRRDLANEMCNLLILRKKLLQETDSAFIAAAKLTSGKGPAGPQIMRLMLDYHFSESVGKNYADVIHLIQAKASEAEIPVNCRDVVIAALNILHLEETHVIAPPARHSSLFGGSHSRDEHVVGPSFLENTRPW